MPEPRYFVIVAAQDPEAHAQRAERHGRIVVGKIFWGPCDEVYGPVEIVPASSEIQSGSGGSGTT